MSEAETPSAGLGPATEKLANDELYSQEVAAAARQKAKHACDYRVLAKRIGGIYEDIAEK